MRAIGIGLMLWWCSAAAANAQATGAVDVSVTILPAPTYVEQSPRMSEDGNAFRVVGAATCLAEATVSGAVQRLGECSAAGTLTAAMWAHLRRAAVAAPVRLTITLDAGT